MDTSLIDSVKTIARAEIPKYLNEKHYGSVPGPLFQILARNGIAGIGLSEKYEGLGIDTPTRTGIIEEIAAVDLGVAVFISVHSMVSGLIEEFATDDVAAVFASKLASGELLGAFALTEPGAGSDAAAIKTTAQKEGDGYILNGEKCYITSAGFADLYIVFAKTNPEAGRKGISAFLVPADTAGLTIASPEKKMGAALSPIASMTFSSVKVPATNLLAEENGGYAIALGTLAGGRISISACAVGLAGHALEKAIAYTKGRKQFGSAVADFQGVQFMLADMKMQLEAARLLTYDAAESYAKDPGARSNRLKASLAKCFATDAAMKITTDAVQLFGGAGYISDYVVEGLMRDAKMLQIVEGTNQIQRSVIARELLRD